MNANSNFASFSSESSQSDKTAATIETSMRSSVKSTRSFQSVKSSSFLKVVVIGDSGVGKTSIIENFKDKKSTGATKPTIGADFCKKIVSLRNSDLRIPL
jgi:GTPase SAR1 family protein